MKMSNVSSAVMSALGNDELSNEEINELTTALGAARERQRTKAVEGYKVGDEVSVVTGRKSNRGKLPTHVTGNVSQIKRTRISVDCGEHGVLNVPVESLSAVTDTSEMSAS
jgi:transcription antitermination factor NusG